MKRTRCHKKNVIGAHKAVPRVHRGPFDDWQNVNEPDDSYAGFALWGKFVAEPIGSMSRRFFLTFDLCKNSWRGHWSIGQHIYYWSSADFGDAYLVSTGRCGTLEDAIVELKSRIKDLMGELSC